MIVPNEDHRDGFCPVHGIVTVPWSAEERMDTDAYPVISPSRHPSIFPSEGGLTNV